MLSRSLGKLIHGIHACKTDGRSNRQGLNDWVYEQAHQGK
jgi:hypothetical protein